MLRTLVSRSIVAVFAVVTAVFFILLVLYCSGNASLAQGSSHSRRVHAAAFKPLKMCKYNGAMGPCGCPNEVNATPVLSGEDKRDVTVTSSTHYIEPGTVVKWHVKHQVICAAYENYEPTAGVFHNVRIKTGKTAGEATMHNEMAMLILWMRPKR